VPGLLGCAYMLFVQRAVHASVEALHGVYTRSATAKGAEGGDPEAGK
jgi:hypothetical protein